jgi:CubicO group peptidase (beta-lactamase class C family)
VSGRGRVVAALLFTASALPLTAAAQDTNATRVDSILAATFAAAGPGAAVAVVQHGQLVLERGYGLAQLEHDVPITPHTVFHVASVSKQFATFAIVLLAQQRKLSLDDDIRQHLPELHDFGHRITIRHLIHHTSGVRDQWELLMMAGWRLDDVITRNHIMDMVRRQRELNFEPGAEHLYSNMGYSLLAEIVERVSGVSFNDFLHTGVFSPLGMSATHVHSDHEMVVPRRAYSYRPGPGGQGWRNSVLSYANQGATSLFTTAGDLGRWLVNFETAQVGGRDAIARMYERGVLNSGDTIAYAFAISRSVHNGRVAWGHGGADAGFRSMVVHFPEERLGVVVLSNAANANPARIALAIADVYLGAPPVAVAPQPAGPPQPASPQQPQGSQGSQWRGDARLADFTGSFYSPELATIYTLLVRDGALFMSHPRLGEARLLPGDEADVVRSGSRTLRFERSADGTITAFRLSGGRVRNLRFLRMPDGVLPSF